MDLKEKIEKQKQDLLKLSLRDNEDRNKVIAIKEAEEKEKLNKLWFQALLHKNKVGTINNSELITLRRLVLSKIKKDSSLINEMF